MHRDAQNPEQTLDGDGITLSSHHYPTSRTSDHDMGKDRPRLEILLDSQCLFLRGAGADTEPVRLSGHVVLSLTESTSIKEITLQFRGKAYLPVPSHDTMTLSTAPQAYIICNHEWSFLEGEKKHSHTLKAGRHFFPFQIQIGGSLPSSLSTHALGGASVAYKLRAHAAMVPVFIVRSFVPEALEYQQSLEIENTWPEKMMYSIMIPHKAWAIGDKLTALVKFSPLSKGVRILSVATTIHETTKVYGRHGRQEATRVVATVKHEISAGRAVETEGNGRPLRSRSRSQASVTPPSPQASSSSSSTLFDPPSSVPEDPEQGQDDIVTYLSLNVPLTATPTHAPEPIIVSHRIRWSIMIRNADEHVSELRCSLPLHILDYRLLTKLGRTPPPPVRSAEESEDTELPSYMAHIRDRVANMFLPESSTIRVTNPWISAGVSPTVVNNGQPTPPLHLPHEPGPEDTRPLDWINSELLLSLSLNEQALEDSPPDSASGTRPQSRLTSRRASRACSPERHTTARASGGETYVHTGHAARDAPPILEATLKPVASMAPLWLPRSSSHMYPAATPPPAELTSARGGPHTDPEAGNALLHRAFTEVPGYAVASRGFIGGVPPLTSMRGLPSYEEAARSHSDSNLAAHFAPVRTSPT
ncbi:hypothetical protein BD779DRAFT_1609885 [Infundibulicybe gibba]|nr:hypothetical protein BD779DRAFT_1609885 [Infundibulicybe gibba]